MSKLYTFVQLSMLFIWLGTSVPTLAQRGGSGDPSGGGHLIGRSNGNVRDLRMAEEHEMEEASSFNLLAESAYRNVAFPRLRQFEQKLPFTGRELRNATFKKFWFLTKGAIDCPFISITIAEEKVPFACQTSTDIKINENLYRHPDMTDNTRGYMIVHEIVRQWTSTMESRALHTDDAIRLITRTIMGNQSDQSLSSLVRVLQSMKDSEGKSASLKMGWPVGSDLNRFREAPLTYFFNDYVWKKVNPFVNDLFEGYCNHPNQHLLAILMRQGQHVHDVANPFQNPPGQFLYQIQNARNAADGLNIMDWRFYRGDSNWSISSAFPRHMNEFTHINMTLLTMTTPYPHQFQEKFKSHIPGLRRKGIEVLDSEMTYSKNTVYFRFKIPQALSDQIRQMSVRESTNLIRRARGLPDMPELPLETPEGLTMSNVDLMLRLIPEFQQLKTDFQMDDVQITRLNGIYRIAFGSPTGKCNKGELDRSHMILSQIGISRGAASSYCDNQVSSYNFLFTHEMSIFELQQNIEISNANILKRLFQTDGRTLLPKDQVCQEVAHYIEKMNSQDPFFSDPHHIEQWMKLAR